MAEGLVEAQPDQWADDRPGGVERALKAETSAPSRLRCIGGHHGVPRRVADALARPVDKPPHERERPRAGQADDRLGDRGDAVPERDHRATLPPVGKPPGDCLPYRGRALGDSLDQPQDRCGRPERLRHEDRKNRVEHLR
jgi:hypothetical protein